MSSTTPLSNYAKAEIVVSTLAGKAVPSVVPLSTYAKGEINVVSLATGVSVSPQPSITPLSNYAKGVVQARIVVPSQPSPTAILSASAFAVIEIGQVPVSGAGLPTPVSVTTITSADESVFVENATVMPTFESDAEKAQSIAQCQQKLQKYLAWINCPQNCPSQS